MDMLSFRLGSGEVVVVKPGSHLLNHENDGILPLLPEALNRIQSGGRDFMEEEIDFGRVIGTTNCVETTETDEIVYAHRMGKDRDQNPRRFDGPSRFVRNRQPEPCNTLLVVLKWDNRDPQYFVVTGFVGKKTAREPWDKFAKGGEKEYWRTHALVFGTFPIDENTITSSIPDSYR
ncbi:hypothetical protein KW782_03890 [Candidatus Parcubacteria bacterium]|nr:hypothetical protein [Candidatus Parcubacteria bacterium]